MAITKERKSELVNQYSEWMGGSKALVLTQYVGLTMKDIDNLRIKVRENGGEFHIIKNTLAKLAFEQAGYSVPEGQLEGSTAIVFAYSDAPLPWEATGGMRGRLNRLLFRSRGIATEAGGRGAPF